MLGADRNPAQVRAPNFTLVQLNFAAFFFQRMMSRVKLFTIAKIENVTRLITGGRCEDLREAQFRDRLHLQVHPKHGCAFDCPIVTD